MNSLDRVVLVCLATLLAGTQFRNTVSGEEPAFTVRLSIPAEEVRLGDIFFAKVVFENRLTSAMYCQPSNARHNLRIELNHQNPFREEIDIHVHGSVPSDCRVGPGRHFKGNEVYSQIIILRAVTADLLFGPAPLPREPDDHLQATLQFEFDLELIPSHGPMSSFPPPTKSKVRQVVQLKYVDTPIHRDKTVIREIHFGGNRMESKGIFFAPSFHVDAELVNRIRPELDDDSNLARFIDYSQRLTELLKSDKSDDTITATLSELLDACAPLEQEFYAREMIRGAKNGRHWNVGLSLAEKYLSKPKELPAPSDEK